MFNIIRLLWLAVYIWILACNCCISFPFFPPEFLIIFSIPQNSIFKPNSWFRFLKHKPPFLYLSIIFFQFKGLYNCGSYIKWNHILISISITCLFRCLCFKMPLFNLHTSFKQYLSIELVFIIPFVLTPICICISSVIWLAAASKNW